MTAPEQDTAEPEYALDASDIAYARRHLRDHGSIPDALSLLALLFFLLAAVLLFYGWHAYEEQRPFTLLVMLAAGFFLCFSFAMSLLTARIVMTWKPPRVCKPPYRISHRLALRFEGLTETSSSGQTTYYWTAIDRIDATATHAFFYTRPDTVVVVPRRAFDSDEAFDLFVDRARDYRQSATTLNEQTL